ncbi:MAG: electron transfer flavoprotein subunit alpha/FixB family protein [Cyanobacteria bacterium NC_groundwater_1444_Ag_S-0.65um_54_12]|nr:electron transfer flavoprotein subunit alpha/FixB family protein [Cyanobacteria bacterium NC_groundwater_1444_Ag_S-0.65um_54_12]
MAENPWDYYLSEQEAALANVAGTLNTTGGYRNIWVFAETTDGFLHDGVREILGKARELGDMLGTRVQAALLGHNVRQLAEDLFSYGCDTVLVAEHPLLANYLAEPYTNALCQLVERYKPEILFFSGTHQGEELAPRLAIQLGCGVVADVVSLDLDDAERLARFTRSTFGDRVLSTSIIPQLRPQIACLRIGAFRAAGFDRQRRGEIAEVPLELANDCAPVKILKEEPLTAIPLEETKVIVAGGKGMGGAPGFAKLEELAKLLKGQVAATRSAVAAGWATGDRQVGMQGRKVSPELYVAVGIAGSLEHQGGMNTARTVVAINRDPDAAIWQIASYGVVGDWQEILPAWIARLSGLLISKR